MTSSDYVQFDPDIHQDEFVQMNIEYITWLADQLMEHYQLDTISMVGSVQEYVESHIDLFTRLKPPNGVLYIIEVDGVVAGMGAFRKLRESVGEVKRMWIRPEFRGRGFGKQMFSKLLDDGRSFGCSEFLLDSGKFMTAAHHIYRKFGFTERERYPESEPIEAVRPYWIWMEMKE